MCEFMAADAPLEQDARSLHKGMYSAWLKKSKSDGAKAKWLSSSTTRYFTIDFDTQCFYYSHSTDNKKISCPIQFDEIQGAERMPPPLRSNKKAAKNQACGFLVHTKDRTFELYTSNNVDAAQWVSALNVARDVGSGKLAGRTPSPPPDSTSTASPRPSTPRSTSEEDEAQRRRHAQQPQAPSPQPEQQRQALLQAEPERSPSPLASAPVAGGDAGLRHVAQDSYDPMLESLERLLQHMPAPPPAAGAVVAGVSPLAPSASPGAAFDAPAKAQKPSPKASPKAAARAQFPLLQARIDEEAEPEAEQGQDNSVGDAREATRAQAAAPAPPPAAVPAVTRSLGASPTVQEVVPSFGAAAAPEEPEELPRFGTAAVEPQRAAPAPPASLPSLPLPSLPSLPVSAPAPPPSLPAASTASASAAAAPAPPRSLPAASPAASIAALAAAPAPPVLAAAPEPVQTAAAPEASFAPPAAPMPPVAERKALPKVPEQVAEKEAEGAGSGEAPVEVARPAEAKAAAATERVELPAGGNAKDAEASGWDSDGEADKGKSAASANNAEPAGFDSDDGEEAKEKKRGGGMALEFDMGGGRPRKAIPKHLAQRLSQPRPKSSRRERKGSVSEEASSAADPKRPGRNATLPALRGVRRPPPQAAPQAAATAQAEEAEGAEAAKETAAAAPAPKQETPQAAPAPPAMGKAPAEEDFDAPDEVDDEAARQRRAEDGACGAPTPAPRKFVAAKVTAEAREAPDVSGDLLLSEVLGAMDAPTPAPFRGSGSHGFVENFHCTGCDMEVLRVENMIWGDEVSYMFLRNNYPNVMKLRQHLRPKKGCSAYCCQCSSRSADAAAALEDVADGLRWRVISA